MRSHSSTHITKGLLEQLYLDEKLSMQEIANRLKCSLHKIDYWMRKFNIKRRNRSDAVYIRNHPNGDPFRLATVDTIEKATLYGLGIGLYWGEGTKASQHSIRLGNTDPGLLNTFVRFLVEIYGIPRDDLKFGLQIFTDIDQDVALDYWTSKLQVKREQFYKVHVTISGSIGTYRKKSLYGVVTLYYHNKRLRDILVGELPRETARIYTPR